MALDRLDRTRWQLQHYMVAGDLLCLLTDLEPGAGERALATYDLAVRRFPTEAAPLMQRALLLQKIAGSGARGDPRNAGYWKQAISDYGMCIAVESLRDNSLMNGGICKYELGKCLAGQEAIDSFVAAIADFEKWATLHPTDWPGYTNMGNALFQIGKLEAALGKNPKASFDASHRAYQLALDLKPAAADPYLKTVNGLVEIGDCLKAADWYERGLVVLETARKVANKTAAYHEMWGRVLGRLGRWAEAVKSLEVAVALYPNSPVLTEKLKAAREAAGQR